MTTTTYPKIADPGVVRANGWPISHRERVDRRTTANGTVYEIKRATPGYEAAGASARWTDGYFRAAFIGPDGCPVGRRFTTLDEARNYVDTRD